jgi:hypothetical protein
MSKTSLGNSVNNMPSYPTIHSNQVQNADLIRPTPRVASYDINIDDGRWVTITMKIQGHIDDFGIMTFEDLRIKTNELLDAFALLNGKNRK